MSEGRTSLLARKNEILAGDKDKIAKQKEAGKLTARERIQKLLDPGTFAEVGALTTGNDGAGEAVAAGYGLIDGRPVYIYAHDFTVKAGAISERSAQKISRVIDLALKTGSPLVAVFDSAGAKIDEGIQALSAVSSVIAGHAKLSGLVPQIAYVAGPCVGSAAVAASMCDFVVMTEKISSLLAKGAQIVSAKTGKDFTPASLGGSAAALKSGGASLCCSTEDEALLGVKSILSFLPSNNMDEAPVDGGEDMNRLISVGSAAELVSQIADGSSVLTLGKDFAPEIICAFIRAGGIPVGVVACDSAVSEEISAKGSEKAARFISFCDSFNIPIVSLIDTAGFALMSADENFASIRSAAKLAYAYSSASVAKIGVIIGKAVGAGYAVMASKAVGADMVYAWPEAVISAMETDAAIRVLFGGRIAAGESFDDLSKEYESGAASPLTAASTGAIDDVIEPESTRKYIISAVEMLLNKREPQLPRKHGNPPA